jgi:hypothetical protein
MAEESKKMNWGKIGLTFAIVFVASASAYAACSMFEHHVMGGKKVKLMPPTPPAAPAKPAA